VYVYSRQALLTRARAFLDHAPPNSLICYAVKANGNPHLLRLLAELGLGADVTSGGELFLALHAGMPANRIVFSGVGKSETELRMALSAGVRALHVESQPEFELIARIAAETEQTAPLSLRLNPDVEAATHPHLRTGRHQDKFGLDAATVRRLLHQAAAHPWLQPVGVAIHIGSQLTTLAPFVQAVEKAVSLATTWSAGETPLQYVDVGGGLGIAYERQAVPTITAWLQAVAAPATAAGFNLVMEPGRSLVGPAGLLLTRVRYVKEQGEKRFVIVDAGMNSLLRPALYSAYHEMLPVQEATTAARPIVDVVGPLCESGDYLARERPLPPLKQGELLAVLDAGAYGFAMSSNYNGQLRPAEALVDGEQLHVIRQPETYETLLAGT